MNIIKELFEKRCKYLLIAIPRMVSEKYERGWLYREDKPIKRIKELLTKLGASGDLTEAGKNLDEIIAICVIWKHSFIDWESVQEEEDRK